MTELYDIAIIGGGPAGSNFARLAAEAGDQSLRILLIDGQTAKRRKPCGGLLAPDAQTVLAQMGLTLPHSILVDPQIFSVKTADLVSGDLRYYPRRYLNMDRYAFDRWLLSLVPPSVEVCRGHCTEVCKVGENMFVLKVMTEDGQKREILSKVLVGADGANSLVRRKFYGGYRGKGAILRYVAIQQWFEADDANPFYSCVFDSETSPSCSWSMFKDGHLIYGGCFPAKDCRKKFDEQKRRAATDRRLFDAGASPLLGDAVITEACMACRPRRPRDLVTGRDGVYLIGEAAGFISPSSFEGISSALVSGRALAEAIAKVGISDSDALTVVYRRKTRALRGKLMLKCVKRVFMYTPLLRHWIMASGLCAINVRDSRKPAVKETAV